MGSVTVTIDETAFWLTFVPGILIVLGLVISNLGAFSMMNAYQGKPVTKGRKSSSRSRSTKQKTMCKWYSGNWLFALGPLLFLGGWAWLIASMWSYSHEDWQQWLLLVSGIVIALSAMYLVNAKYYRERRGSCMGNSWGALYWLCVFLFVAGWTAIGITISIAADDWWAILIPLFVFLGLGLVEVRRKMGWGHGVGYVLYTFAFLLIAWFLSTSDFRYH